MRQANFFKQMFPNNFKTFNADQPLNNLFNSILNYIGQPKRSVALRTPRIILLGLPGSGKRIQANLLAKKFNFVIIDCGRLILEQIANRTTFGKLMRNYVHKNLPSKILIIILKIV